MKTGREVKRGSAGAGAGAGALCSLQAVCCAAAAAAVMMSTRRRELNRRDLVEMLPVSTEQYCCGCVLSCLYSGGGGGGPRRSGRFRGRRANKC